MGYSLVINGVHWAYNPLILIFYPNFLGHLSIGSGQISSRPHTTEKSPQNGGLGKEMGPRLFQEHPGLVKYDNLARPLFIVGAKIIIQRNHHFWNGGWFPGMSCDFTSTSNILRGSGYLVSVWMVWFLGSKYLRKGVVWIGVTSWTHWFPGLIPYTPRKLTNSSPKLRDHF